MTFGLMVNRVGNQLWQRRLSKERWCSGLKTGADPISVQLTMRWTMPDKGSGQVTDGDQLEAEAHALVEIFNEATPSYSPELEWFAMGHDRETDEQSFVFEAESYIDSDGLAALREAGRSVNYIEAYQKPPRDALYCQIQVSVQGEVPEVTA